MYDIVRIVVQGGKGGDGAISFRHEKYVPYGGPDGGDGGVGGSVVLLADPSVTDFKAIRNGGIYKATAGGNGTGAKKTGKNGQDTIIHVPVGTMVYQEKPDGERELLVDLSKTGEKAAAATGGKGGRGNQHFANPIIQTPRLAEVGEEGEQRSLVLELRLIADVGIIGYPNVGKSSLLAAASRAKPKIADYPFTTREPELGVVDVGNDVFVLAEIPGLIEGASQGKGLGYDFLRHSTRTRAFIHLIDGSSESPVADMFKVNNEMALYDPALAKRPQIVIVNKIDVPAVRERVDEIKADFAWNDIRVRFISARTGEGVRDLMKAAYDLLKKPEPPQKIDPDEIKVFRPAPRPPRVRMNKKGTIFIIDAPDIERIVARVDMEDPMVLSQLRAHIIRRGIARELEKLGIKGGSRVRCDGAEWEW